MEFAGNLVNTDDVGAVFRQLRRRPLWLLGRFVPGGERRVRQAWAQIEAPPIQFWDAPGVNERRAHLATGDPHLTIPSYVARTYLQHGARGVSLGCGTGRREVMWSGTGVFSSLACYDLAPEAIDHARRLYGDDPVLDFEVANAYELDFPQASLDVVIFEDALHHLSPVETILQRCRDWLAPGGIIVVNEYVGPRRFQHSDRLLEAAEATLSLLPERLRVGYEDGRVKRATKRPSLLRMRLKDPSEAIESDLIRPTIRQLFDVIEERELGGGLVSAVLSDIAHHFADGHESRWVELIFSVEDALLEAAEIDSYYAFMIGRRTS